MPKVQQKKETRIVLTGGHGATTAYAFISEARYQKLDWNFSWIGRKYSMEGKNDPTLEYRVFSKMKIPFYHIISGRVQRKFTFWTIPSLLKIPIGFINAFFILLKLRPKLILSFGGYAAHPVVVVGSLMGTNVVIHEQTTSAGLANEKSARFAKIVAISRSSSFKYFPKEKSVLIGNPLSPELAGLKVKTKLSYLPRLFVSGGSRGSLTINKVIFESIEKLVEKHIVVHQTGFEDYDTACAKKEDLPRKLKARYQIHSSVLPSRYVELLDEADIFIARSGANTVSAILAARRPAILIPIPWSYRNEQQKNAEYAKSFGIAEILTQDDLSVDTLIAKIDFIVENYENIMGKVANKKSPDTKAAGALVKLIKENLV